MSRYEARLTRLEHEGADACQNGCVKCALAKIAAEHRGMAWSGCDRRPMGLIEILLMLEEPNGEQA